ncbi:MAG: (d)CMP kinase [candidate division WOR-3 bacterium]|nr:MAG: (d)CMP kinase [candidate division WOR-3 bacterium]
MARFVVAIDGGAGSGKSTTAKGVAKRLDFFYIDTGAMYRAFTLKYLRSSGSGSRKVDIDLIRRLLRDTTVDLRKEDNEMKVYLDNEDVSLAIRTPEVSDFVSQVSAISEVRDWMVKRQREVAEGKNVVCEGRDIGTVVFPDAQVKIFMVAEVEVRAARRLRELGEKHMNADENEVMENIRFRDKYDSEREHSPLRRANDAIVVDTTNLTIEEEIEQVKAIVEKRLAAPEPS